MAHAQGSCSSCTTPLFVLKWEDGKRYLYVECYECGQAMKYDLSEIISALGSRPETEFEKFVHMKLPNHQMH